MFKIKVIACRPTLFLFLVTKPEHVYFSWPYIEMNRCCVDDVTGPSSRYLDQLRVLKLVTLIGDIDSNVFCFTLFTISRKKCI